MKKITLELLRSWDKSRSQSILQEKRERTDSKSACKEDKLLRRSSLSLILMFQTLQYAYEHIPYYQALFKKYDFNPAAFKRMSDIETLPVMFRGDVVESIDRFINPHVEITSMKSTSGTTSKRLPLYNCQEELEASAILQRLRFPPKKKEESSEFILRLYPATRRIVTMNQGGISPIRYVTIFFYDFHDLPPDQEEMFNDWLISQIYAKYPIPHTSGFLTAMAITIPSYFTYLSREIFKRNLDPEHTHIRRIMLLGGIVTDRMRRLAEENWRGIIQASHHCTELNTTSYECPLHRNVYHHDLGKFIEVVDPGTFKPVEEGGEGLFLITTYHPFHQSQIFVRYSNGDMVRRLPDTCECGFVGQSIEFLGRADQCLNLSDILPAHYKRKYIASYDLINIFHEFDEIPYHYYPKFKVLRNDTQGSFTLISIFLEVFPETSQEKREKINIEIIAKIKNIYTEWKEIFSCNRLKIELKLLDYGQLDDYFIVTPV